MVLAWFSTVVILRFPMKSPPRPSSPLPTRPTPPRKLGYRVLTPLTKLGVTLRVRKIDFTATIRVALSLSLSRIKRYELVIVSNWALVA